MFPVLIDALKDFSFWAAILAIGTAKLAFSANPNRPLNRIFAIFALCIAAWQACELGSHVDYEAGFWLCAGSSFSALMILLIALCLDCVVHPISDAKSRLRRQIPFAAISLGLACARWLPWWNPMIVASPRASFVFFIFYNTTLLCSLATVAMLSLRYLKNAPPAVYFELKNFTGWAFAAVLVGGLMVLSRRVWPTASTLSSAILFGYFIWTVHSMTSDRIFGVRDAMRFVGEQLTVIAVQFALTWTALAAMTVLSSSVPTSTWQLALVLALVAYLAAYLSRRIVTQVFTSYFGQAEKSLRTLALKLVSGVWSETALISQFRKLLSGYLNVNEVTVAVLDAPGMAALSAPRRRLVEASLKRSWLTPESAGRMYSDHHLTEVRECFQREGLSGLIVHSTVQFRVAFFIGHGRGGPTVLRWNEVTFCLELAQIFAAGVDRLRAAAKALHANRLAIVGFMASQFRHEARNRMETIIAVLELLAEGEESAISKEHREMVLKEARSFADDQEMALLMARSDNGKVDIVPCRIGALLSAILTGFNHVGVASNVRVEFVPPVMDVLAMADEKLLRQVILNVLRNSVQALEMTPDPRISVKVSTESNVMHIDISDNGPGVPPVVHDQLFQPFTTSKKGGTGIGLSICADAMGMLNGSIKYTTPRGKPHASFRVTLPLAVADAAEGTLQMAGLSV